VHGNRRLWQDLGGCDEIDELTMSLRLLCTNRCGCDKVDEVSNEFKVLVHGYKWLWQYL